MAKVKYIPCDVYKRGIYVFIGSLSELKSYVKSTFTEEEYEDFVDMVMKTEHKETYSASFFYNNLDGQGIVHVPRYPRTPIEIGALAHEILHATFHVLNFCHVEYTYDGNNEAYTYLHEHLMRGAFEENGYKKVQI